MDPQIVPADKRLRVVTLLAAVLVLAAGAVMLAMLSAELRELREPGGAAGKGGNVPDAMRNAGEAPGGIAPAANAADPLEAAIERLERWTTAWDGSAA